jgi:hypothetical protein
MDSHSTTDRSLLCFVSEVGIQFAFLESLGFCCVFSEINLVRFESPKININIYHEKLSYEIGSSIEFTGESEIFSFSEILRLVHGKEMEQYRDYATHTVEGVAEGVRKLVELFRECVATGFLNNNQLFSLLTQQRRDWAKKYALETQLKQALKKSEFAWNEKNFGEVVKVLAPLEEHLNSTDLKRFEYAKKHSNSTQ